MKSLTQSHIMKFPFRPFALCVLILIITANVHAGAAPLTWDPSLNQTGSDSPVGTWNTTSAVWANGTADQAWSNTTSSTAVFGGSYSSATAASETVTVGSVNVGTIQFNQPANGNITYKLFGTGGTSTITGSGTLTIDGTISTNVSSATSGPEAVFGGGTLSTSIKFTDASTYLFQTLSGTSANGGVQLSGVSFNGGSGATIQLGNGSDVGQLLDYNTSTTPASFGTNSVIVNNGWELFERNYAVNNASLTLNGFGTAGTTDRGALRIQPQTGSTGAWAGAITLGSDAMIVASGSAANSIVSGNIGGSHNLFVGGGGSSATSNLVLKGANTYTGATVIFNAITTASGSGQDVQLGADNTLPLTTTVVLGVTSGTPAITGAAATHFSSNGTLDLGGFNQTVTDIQTGAGTTAASQIVENNSGAGTSTLTVSNSSGAQFGGTIKDTGATAGGKVALAITGGNLNLGNNNTFTGGTSISNSGILTTSNSITNVLTSSAVGTGPVSLGVGTIAGTGSVAGLVTASGASASSQITAATTSTIGNLTLNTGITSSTGLTLNFAIDGVGAYNSTLTLGASGLTVIGTSLVFNLYDLGNDALQTDTPYTLITGTGALSASEITANLLDSDYYLNTAYGTNGILLDGNVATFEVTLSAVPEPSTLGYIVSGGVFLLLFLRRRRGSANFYQVYF